VLCRLEQVRKKRKGKQFCKIGMGRKGKMKMGKQVNLECHEGKIMSNVKIDAFY